MDSCNVTPPSSIQYFFEQGSWASFSDIADKRILHRETLDLIGRSASLLLEWSIAAVARLMYEDYYLSNGNRATKGDG